MSCPLCGDKGIVRLRYRDGSPDTFGVCRCDAGQILRSDRNATGKSTGLPAWQIWAAREGVDPAQVVMVEDLLEPEELAGAPTGEPPSVDRSRIAEAMQTKRPKL